jgi:hypothetical protein
MDLAGKAGSNMQRRHPNCGIFLLKIMVRLIKILLYKIGTVLPGKVANLLWVKASDSRNPVLIKHSRIKTTRRGVGRFETN